MEVPDNFLPFGKGEKVTPRLENGSSEAITFQQPFKYFGRSHNETFVSNNGLLTFTGPTSDCNPILHSGKDLIAPLWTHLDNTKGGTISYREETNITVLAQITAVVKANLTSSAASSAFIVTWDSVPYYSGRGVATFQAVLLSNEDHSFMLVNYGNVSGTDQTWLAGYDTEDSVSSFTMPVSNPHDLSSVSNTNVDGRCSFKVDGSSNLPTNFPAPAIGNIVNPTGNNGSSYVIFLKQPFTYFQRTYQKIFLNSNGFITFTEPLSSQNSSLEMKRDIIAPFWTRLDNRVGGTVSYREDTSTVLLAKVTAAVNQYFPNIPFVATSTFVATWDSVPYSSGGGVVTFQIVVAYNIHRSFVLIYYGDLARTGQQWQAGYNTVDSVDRFIIPASSVSELSSRSNVNVTACWAFHVDGSADLPANFLPLGNGERVTPRLDNGSSEAITLEQPFKYFGRPHNQTYVSNNGLLTFTSPISECNPILHSGKDLIAPLWTHLDNTKGGTISYREETNITVLAQITAAVKANLTSSAASSAFVVTWDSVPYYSGRGVATFQAVLLSNKDHSFMLVNYGNVSGTDQTWLAGYDTEDSVSSFTMPVSNPHDLSSVGNTNVDGRCSFKVDGSSNLPTNFPASAIGNIVNPTGNNGSSYVIFLKQPFTYFQRTYQKIFLNSHGFVTFTEPLSSQNSSLEMKRDIIAPFWTRLDNRVGGSVSYREDTSTVLLAKVTAAVNQYFPNIPFVATSTFVATWDSVPYSSGGGVVTFQLVLAYNIHRSFVLMYYGDLARTGQQWQAGYNTVDSVDRFIIPASSVSELSSMPANFLPLGKGERVTPRLDNGSSEAITLEQPFQFFGRPHNQTYVSNNGLLTFTGPTSDCNPILHSGRDLIAPLWTHLDNTKGGTISYREETNITVLAQITATVKANLTSSAASSAFIVTWDSVPYYSGRGVATFQAVLLSNEDHSFMLVNYGNVSGTDQTWLAGYDTEDSVSSFTMPVSNPHDLSSVGNTNVDGRCSFKVDGSSNVPTNFPAPAIGNIVNPMGNNGSSYVIFLKQPFTYFQRTYQKIFLNSNGFITFTEPLSSQNSSLEMKRDIIAPFWTRLDNRVGGTVSYREDTSTVLLAKVTAAVNQYFPNIPFVATSTFVATWDSVPYSSGGGVVTFQLVLAYNIHRSFVLIYYGDLARTGQQWQAGYNTVDSVDRFIIPASSVSELSSRSNVNVIACWAFHVDGSSDLPANFLPLGKGERVTPRLDNGSSEAITLEQPFQFFGRTHNQTYVSNNGLLTFTGPTSDCNPILHSGKDLIAPLWTHLDNTKGGTISYREETNITVLAQITATVKANLTSSAASSAFIVTWDSVPYYSGRGVATFQAVLLSNEDHSFMLVNYGNVSGTDQTWLAGYDTEDSVSSFTMPVSNPHDLSSVGNTNVDGRCSFKVDGSSNVPTNFPAPAIGNIVNPTGNNGSSYVIFLKQPFTYFQRTYQKIFLNSNGFITFTEPLSSQNSSLEMKRDIIAPFWTRLDNRVGGTVSYREDTSTVLLAKVTAAVNQYFPNIPFVATSTFVATWDSVPYSSGGGVVTFQLVLAYNIHRSFVLIYYGDLARTGQQWQAGYNTVDSVDRFIIPASSVSELSSRSNVNVIACWAFHVDGSSDLPANFLPLGKGERVTPRLDNGSSEAITLEHPFQFFGRPHNQTYDKSGRQAPGPSLLLYSTLHLVKG
ncbi:hypothetical protein DNTS_022841 [Danionella cerebrum]|uniref:NIDO domain-containing protein n=1 Tax=Danionella cerebrum TaxID=2873325 RepID=A0A553QYZ3_9TELE|nr:hypothetical protein DNTS_022841 [Danionella translucida]